jgi:3-oxoacyl-[acyl-carrier protein] reductase
MSERQRVVLVTGSSRGIGRGIAIEMARQGYAVAVHGSADSPTLSLGSSIRAMFDAVRAAFGGLTLGFCASRPDL